ncbi:MAG TPA: heme NO-binding domain-containing protein [Polyangiaceae bacterium]|nr:heme NO-binding domain-containing protein [Polyangiaceae bacterium]
MIHTALEKYVESSFGAETWKTLLARTGLEGAIFTPLGSYPDAQISALVKEAEALSNIPAATLLEGFGEFLVPTYLALYGSLLKPEWRTLEVIENTEETVHRVVRIRNPGAEPPRLRVRRTAPDEVELTYDSERKLCAVARGIARGVAKKFEQPLETRDRSCMLRGDPACVITFRVRP